MNEIKIQVDSREKERAITNIVSTFASMDNIKFFTSKLYVGDYMLLNSTTTNHVISVDRKQNLTELCSTVVTNHERFRNEILRAMAMDIKMYVLIEHGKDITELEDVKKWENPRRTKRVRNQETGLMKTIVNKRVTSGETLYKICKTMERKYDVKFVFCDKEDTGNEIIRLLTTDWQEREVEELEQLEIQFA